MELPEIPAGAELVLEVGDLEVYKTFDGELCAGTLRRIELHANALAELFDMEIPVARVFMYGRRDDINDVCLSEGTVRGCSTPWSARALPDSVTHELGHIFVLTATKVRTRPMIEEGFAWSLQGDWYVPGRNRLTYNQFEALLAIDSALELAENGGGTHFFSWALERFGAEPILNAHISTFQENSLANKGVALAEAFGFTSLRSLYEAYEESSAIEYPPFSDAAPIYNREDLTLGRTIDTSCEGESTEGPTDGVLTTRALIEVERPGEHAFDHGDLPSCGPRWRPQQPIDVFPDIDLQTATMCSFDQDPPHSVFYLPGLYEVAFGNAWCRAAPETTTTLQLSALNDGFDCSYP